MHKTKSINNYLEVSLTISLMKGDNHYILDKYVDDKGKTEFTFIRGETSYKDEFNLRAFERVSVTGYLTYS